MSEPLDPTDTPLASIDADSITALFHADPTTVPRVDRLRLITELRRRADVAKAEAAAAALDAQKPKLARPRRSGRLVDAALAAIADKPVSELTADDLFGDDE